MSDEYQFPHCPTCDGDGWFTETVEGSDGRDHEIDYQCPECRGSGVAP